VRSNLAKHPAETVELKMALGRGGEPIGHLRGHKVKAGTDRYKS
jgi:hypothetical protein